MASATERKESFTNPLKSVRDYKEVDPHVIIRDVWAHNFREEMQTIMSLVDDFPFIAMDTEFPGTVASPTSGDMFSDTYQYQKLKCNVDVLKIIQLGLTLCDAEGKTPLHTVCTWQFNFKFDLGVDIYSEESIEFLKKSGIAFRKHKEDGIDVQQFGEMLMMSGIVLNEDVHWITFHSMFDYGYLVKVLTCEPLPDQENAYFDLFRTFFPNTYDLKFLAYKSDLKGGLNSIAKCLKVPRIGPEHQAGSDSLLTAATFFKVRDQFYSGSISTHFNGVVFGLGRNLKLVRKSDTGNEFLSQLSYEYVKPPAEISPRSALQRTHSTPVHPTTMQHAPQTMPAAFVSPVPLGFDRRISTPPVPRLTRKPENSRAKRQVEFGEAGVAWENGPSMEFQRDAPVVPFEMHPFTALPSSGPFAAPFAGPFPPR